jgi:hypothetical protein
MFKVIEISEKGDVNEVMQFEHPTKSINEMHLYFNNDFSSMVEVLINKQKKFAKATYNIYSFNGQADSRGKWHFDNTVN